MGDNPRLTFRISLWRPWLLAITPLALLAALGLAITLPAVHIAAAMSILFAFAGIALLLLLPIGLATRGSRWHVDPSGIGGPNNQLVYHWLAWSEIESVAPWPIPGYHYVQVNGVGKRRAFWLPLFFTDMPSFRAALAQFAPPGNPLPAYLEKHPA
jgi:hypothetical protein